MAKAPAFQFYPADYLADENVAMMTLEEEGAYIRLMCYCWRQGTIPDDVVRLALLCRTTQGKMGRIWQTVGACFTKTDNGRLVHTRLDAERTKQSEYSAKMSEAGKRGAAARKAMGGYTTKHDGQATTKPQPGHNQADGVAVASDGSSSLSSSSKSNNTSKSAVAKEKRKKPTEYPPEFLAIWALHPRGAKGEALKEWRRAVPELIADQPLRNALEAYCRTLRADFQGMHLFRWLRDERWEEATAARSAGPKMGMLARP